MSRPYQLLLLVVALAGCGSQAPSPAPPSAAPTVDAVAVAKGWLDTPHGPVRLGFQRAGRVDEVYVHVGQRVTRGAQVARLSDSAERFARDEAATQVELATQQLAQLETRLRGTKTRVDRLESAVRQRVGDPMSVDEARVQLDELAGQRDNARLAVDLARQHLAVADLARAETILTAPVDGTLSSVGIQAGDLVQSNEPGLVTLQPDEPLMVRAEVAEVYADAVKVGMRATVVPDNDSGAVWAAHVSRVGGVAERPRAEGEGTVPAGARVVQMDLTPDRPIAARSGTQVIVRVLR